MLCLIPSVGKTYSYKMNIQFHHAFIRQVSLLLNNFKCVINALRWPVIMRTFITQEGYLEFWRRNSRRKESFRPRHRCNLYQPATQQNTSTTTFISLHYILTYFRPRYISSSHYFFSSVVVTSPVDSAVSNMSFRHATLLLFFPTPSPGFSNMCASLP